MNTLTGELVITESENQEFARISGDSNPLHVDAVYARRLQFGGPVIHGVQHMLRVWDHALAQLPEAPPKVLSGLSASFPNPAVVGEPIQYTFDYTADQGVARLAASCRDKPVLSLLLRHSDANAPGRSLSVIDGIPPLETPVDQDFPPGHSAGELQLFAHAKLVEKTLPFLSGHYPLSYLAQIFACTRIVGMKCPGLHSVFSGLKLDFSNAERVETEPNFHYSVARADERFRMVKIAVQGPEAEGVLDTFFRPPPVAQPDFATVFARIEQSLFLGQRALVVGGSRGIGETTAKILAAGGAQVAITYQKGSTEALSVQQDIQASGGYCEVAQLDVGAVDDQPPLLFEGQLAPTHIYYFASPHITPNNTKTWDSTLFDKFCAFYLKGFVKIVDQYASLAASHDGKATFFYPSTIYIDEPEKGFLEYVAAKAAGEALCSQLGVRYGNAEFFAPRLPRVNTDQTASIIPIKCESTLEIMYKALSSLIGSQ